MTRIIVNSTSDLLAVSTTETREIPTTVQGSNNATVNPYLFQWEQLDSTPRDLSEVVEMIAVIVYPDGVTVSNSGDIDVKGDQNNYFEWAADDTDTGTPGALYVTFKATFSDNTVLYTIPARWIVLNSPTVDAVAGPPLTGITEEQAVCLTNLCRLIQITNDDMFIGVLTDYQREVFLSATRIFIKEVGANIIGTNFLDGSVDYCEIRPNVQLVNGAYKFTTAFPQDVSAGAFVLDVTTFFENYFAGVVGDTAGTSPDKVTLQAAQGFDLAFMNTFKDYFEFAQFGGSGALDIRMGAQGVQLPAYSSDADAGVGGVITGQLWQTDTGAPEGAGAVKIKQTVSPPPPSAGPLVTAFTWSQSGTNAPVVSSILINQNGVTITPTRVGAGSFVFTVSSNIFTFGGKWNVDSNGIDSNDWHLVGRNSDNSFFLENRNAPAGTTGDGVSQFARTVITVYP